MQRTDPVNAIVVASALALTAWITVSCQVPGLNTAAHFVLDGAHSDLACGDCHTEGLEVSVPRDCRGCHVDDAPPDHFPDDCGECHTTTRWDDLDVDHSFFPLERAHGGLECAACHIDGDYKSAVPACESCHEEDRPPGHFSGPCAECHDITRWEDGVFDHTGFLPLQGGHAGLECTACHVAEGDYAGLDAACESCHTSPPNHYPGACSDCHNVFDWEDADFDHDPFFPTPHNGVSACASCHPGGDTSDFTCTGCHEHNRPDTNDDHNDVGRYVYKDDACLDCHPRGRE
ncbi:MAG: hypothetical protein ACI8PZ_004917 [Myxococcota bacterium]|jgi:hypothetical protein